MSVTALWPDAREAMRIEAHRRRLVRCWEHATLPLHTRVWRWFLTWALRAAVWAIAAPFAVWPENARGLFLFAMSAAFWVSVGRKWLAHNAAPTRSSGLGAFALLHAPSRSGLLAVSWLRALPTLLWIGSCAVVFLARRSDTAARAPVAVAAVGLTPSLLFAFSRWHGLAADRDDWTLRDFGGVAMLSLAVLAVVGAVAGVAAGIGGDVSGWVGAPVLVAISALLAYLVRQRFGEWRRRRNSPDAMARAVLRCTAVLATAAWVLTLLWVLDSKNHRALGSTLDSLGSWAGPLALAPVLFAGCVFVVDQFEWIETAQVGVFADKPRTDAWRPSVGRSRETAASGMVPPGRGLWRAQWRRFREEKLSALDSIVFVVISLRGVIFAAFAVALADSPGAAPLAWAAWTAPRLVEIEAREIDRLRLFGVSLRAIVLHNLAALLVAAALPALGVAVVTGSIAGWTHARVAAFELIAAGFVLRAGFAGLARIGRRIGALTLAASLAVWWIAASAAVAYFMPTPSVDSSLAWAMVVPVLVPGLIGIILGPLCMSEAELCADRRSVAEGSTSPSGTGRTSSLFRRALLGIVVSAVPVWTCDDGTSPRGRPVEDVVDRPAVGGEEVAHATAVRGARGLPGCR